MNSAERREARYQRRKAARAERKAAALREYGDFEAVFSFERLYESYRASVRGVGWKASTQRYKASVLANITKTNEELLAGKYRSKGFYEFDLVERGKPRHIRSVHISERVVQRCLCDYCLVPMLSRSFIYDNGASLRGKGYDFAVKRVTQFLARHYRKYGREGYVLVFDFSKYFDRAKHEPIFAEIERSGIDERIVSISKYFISNFGDVGLGLGSQVSQIAALALPNKIDHYIKDVLGMKYYARYMDDGCIISESKEKLEICLRELRRLCAEHGIKLNEKKTQIIKLSRGFTFVKVRFRYGANGKVIRKATYKGIRHMRNKLRIFRRWVDSGRMDAADVAASLVSWRGHMRRFHSYHAAQRVETLYRELFTGG
jgi:RNA-directed DNA polymerase